MDRRDTAVTMPWMGAGTELIRRAVGALPDDALRAPSALPGWTRAHAAEIESSAKAPADVLRSEFDTTAETLDAALAALDATTWQAQVRSALGRPIPAAEIPWMRVREVWLHAVDLDAGVSVADLPPDVVDALLDDATGTLSAAEGCPAALLAPTDRDRTWSLGPAADDPVRLRGEAASVLGWLVGRSGPEGVEALAVNGTPTAVPAPPRWL